MILPGPSRRLINAGETPLPLVAGPGAFKGMLKGAKVVEVYRSENHKEVFRLWYECIMRTNAFWEAYHIFVKNSLNRHKRIPCAMVKYALEIMPNTVTGYDNEVEFVNNRYFFLINSKMNFIAAQWLGFDEAWNDCFKKGFKCRSYGDVSDVKNVMADCVSDYIDGVTIFAGYQGDPGDNERLKLMKNITTGSCSLGPEWWALTGFDVGHADLAEFITSLSLFSEESMRINLSVYPFGKTKKEILEEVWDAVSEFKENRKRKTLAKDATQWFAPYGRFRPDEIKRYLGVFDLRAMNKTYKQIIRGDYEDFGIDCIQEVRKFYTGRVQSAFDDTTMEVHRMLVRDFAKAEALITNALAGYFPKYPED